MRHFAGVLSVLVLSAAAAAAADAKPGQAAYERECKDCHQMNGAPVSSVDKAMVKQGVHMRDLKAKEVQAQSDADWKKAIVEGSGKMKPVKGLSGPDVDGLLAYMHSLKKK